MFGFVCGTFHLKRAGTRGTHNINKGPRIAIYAQTYTVFVLICEIFLQIRHLGYDFVKFRTTQVRSQFRYAICVPQQTGSCFNFVTTYDRNAVPTLIYRLSTTAISNIAFLKMSETLKLLFSKMAVNRPEVVTSPKSSQYVKVVIASNASFYDIMRIYRQPKAIV
jgi:hypothetical protein